MKAENTYSPRRRTVALAMVFLLLSYSVSAHLVSSEIYETAENRPVTVSLLDNLVWTAFCQLPSAKYEYGNQRGFLTCFSAPGNLSLNLTKSQSDVRPYPTEMLFRLAAIPTYLFIRILRI